MSDDSSPDRVFAKRLSDVRAFEFNEAVADVFRDMITRSVPGYPLLLHLIALYADVFVQAHSRVYDLGCSLGEVSQLVAAQTAEIEPAIIAVDNSAAMIAKCKRQNRAQTNIEWRCEDIRQTEITNASLVVLNLTLQFLDPEQRQQMLDKIYRGLNPGGVLVLSEKVVFDDEAEGERMIELHQAFKKTMGYSDLEISQKRSALENVLIPESDRLHLQRLEDTGFSEVYACFRCFNFVSYLAIKA